MPNHITNVLTINGTPEQVEEIYERFSKSYKAELNTAHDGKIICNNKEDGSYGWLDLKTGIFDRRNEVSVLGLPEGYEIEISEAWTRFPDFDKILPSPPELEDLAPHHRIVTAVKKKYSAPVSGNKLLAVLEFGNRETQTMEFEGEEKDLFEKCCIAYEKTGFTYWYYWNVANWGTKWNAYSCERRAWNVFKFETAWSSVLKLITLISEAFPEISFDYKYADEDTGYNTGKHTFLNGLNNSYIPKGGSKSAYELAFSCMPERRSNYVLNGEVYEYKDEE